MREPVTGILTTRTDPFTDAICRDPARLARWWDVDAKSDERRLAALLCNRCPARVACDKAASRLGAGASGTWAGVYRSWKAPKDIDDDAMHEFLTVFGPSAATSDNPMPATLTVKPRKEGRYWVHPSQLRLEWREAN